MSTITDAQIESLRDAAERAGDGCQVAICRLALGDSTAEVLEAGYYLTHGQMARIASMTQEQARAECARVLSDAGDAMERDADRSDY